MKYKFLLLFFFLIIQIQLNAEDTSTLKNSSNFKLNPYPLYLNNCIEIAIKNNIDVIISKYNIELENEKIKNLESVYEPNLSASYIRTDNDLPSLSSAQSTKSKEDSLDLSISKDFKTGASLSIIQSLNKENNSSGTINPYYKNDLNLSIIQPLLKNKGKDINTTYIQIENNNKNISELELYNQLISIIGGVSNDYWTFVYSKEIYAVKKQTLKLAENLLEDNKKRVSIGTLAPIEIISAEAGVAAQQEGIIVSANDILNNQDILLQRMNLTDSEYFNNIEFLPADTPGVEQKTPDINESINYSLRNRPDYLSLKKLIESSDIKLKYYQNQKLPELDLKGTFGLNGLDRYFDESYNNILKSDYNNWSVGLELKIPIGNSGAKSNIKMEEVNKSTLLWRLKKLENDIITEVKTQVRNITTTLKRIEAAKISVKLAEENLKAEMKRFELLQTTTFNVLQYQAALDTERSNLLKAIIDNQQAVISYEMSTGMILEKNNIILKLNKK